MTQKQALKLRTAIKAILSFSEDGRYEVAIQERGSGHKDGAWEVHIFVRDDHKSGLLNCALLANAIEQISTDCLATESEYNMGIREVENIRQSFKIW